MQFTAKRIIQIHRGRTQPRPLQQLALGRAVVGHVAVVIQMITREIGEHRNIKMHAIHAPLIECMRRHFHRHC